VMRRRISIDSSPDFFFGLLGAGSLGMGRMKSPYRTGS
jgi:hypothetical protein